MSENSAEKQWAILQTDYSMSPSVGKIAEALAKAQLTMESAKKSAFNPAFKSADKPKGSKYADLAAIIEVTRALNAQGIAVFQSAYSTPDGAACVTKLIHSSGEWLKSDPLVLPVTKKDAQGYGSTLTYAKRQSLSAAANISADDDDDGNEASGKTPAKTEAPKTANTDKPKPSGAENLRKDLERLKGAFEASAWDSAKKEAQALKAKGVEFDDDFRALYSAVKAIADKKVA